MQTPNRSDESASRDIDSLEPIYAGHGTPDIHKYGKRTAARWMTCVAAVIIMHVALIALLWIAGVYESTRMNQDLAITLSDSGGQSSVVFIMETSTVAPTEEPIADVLPEPIVEPVPTPVLPSDPVPVQEQASLRMPEQSKVQEQPIIETKSPETTKPQERAPVAQEPPPVIKPKPVTKPIQAAPPPKKQPTTQQPNNQSGAAEQAMREEPNGSSQSREPTASEGSNTTAQTAPKLVKSPKPRYPSEAIRLRQEGRVVVNLEVLESGEVGQATIAQSSGFSALDQSALEAVKNWQYANGSASGQLLKQWVRVSIIFELKNR